MFSNIGDEQPVQTGVTNMRGLLIFDGLTEGATYYLQEIKAPEGYPINEQYKTPNSTGEITTTGTKIPVESGLSPVTLTVIKQDSENQTPLSGAESALYSDIGCKIQVGTSVTTNSNGEAEFTDLNANQRYWLKETKAPEGYILDGKITEIDFTTIKNDELIITNKKDSNVPPVDPDPPEGGGGSSSGGGGSSEKPTEPDKEYVLEYECNGGTFYGDETYSPDELVRLGKVPYRAGYVIYWLVC